MIIYKTTNLINNRFYVGKDAKNDKNYLGSGKILRQAIKKYGKENFIKETLEVCKNLQEMEEREKYWINKLNATENGYNLTEGGTGGDTWTHSPKKVHWNVGNTPWNKGKPPSPETREKISKNRKGKMKGGNKSSYKPGKDHVMYGTRQSEDTVKKRVSTRRKNNSYKGIGKFAPKGVKNIEDGREFNSIQEAADFYAVSRDIVGHSCRKETKKGKFRFIYE
jgi:group I intron endonuclease